ncbi:hypothetical protein LK994_04235 [Ferruginibacter lapsinanis]|uniref:hypothetical protein n=1 Tax=Ferruginibacter lapsinanis TaxID=563172 RepID=UPI001E3519EA|nr:hypothetical protein [Ferruginibacter lapsinanis]UEG50680.1 hypothetical protein LK994_04235 [Ferruginibacter lapsinanis]
MLLLPNERQIVTANDDKIILTNQLIQLNDKSSGNSYQITMFLENISSFEKRYISYPFLLILSVLAILFGAATYINGAGGDREESPFIIVGGIILLIIWFFTKKHIIKIKSDGGSSLDFVISKMSDELVEDFLYKVSVAKLNRVANLNILAEVS